MTDLCELFGVSKQAYYQYDENAALAKIAREDFALQFIKEIRREDPGIGGPKLWLMYQQQFGCDYPIGRDRFCDILDRNNLKVRLKIRKPRTTDSTHGLPVYANLVKDFIPIKPNQLWVSDITYIVILDGETSYHFCYLSMILDAYTKEIIGWSVGASLETTYPMKALKMALQHIGNTEITDLIHHSDRGCQYASYEYTNLLREHGIRISMTESGDPKDNAQAERINNTMKNELLLGRRFFSIEQVIDAVSKAIDFYNNKRPHMSIDMMTPAQAAICEGEIDKWWHSYREDAIKAKAEEITEKCLPLCSCQGSPSGQRPPVNP